MLHDRATRQNLRTSPHENCHRRLLAPRAGCKPPGRANNVRTSMVVIRPVSDSDVEQLLDLANLAGVGLTTLPKDRDLLKKRVARSMRSFEKNVERPGGESYLFVM